MSKIREIFSDELPAKRFKNKPAKKHTLDSDEEDESDHDNVLDKEVIEGEEEGVAINIGQENFTAFNMNEEMEVGHFDKDGHFIWKKEKEVCDNWLDNIDWQKIKTKNNASNAPKVGEESDGSDEEQFQEIETYQKILAYMQPRETLNVTIRRLGKNKKLSSLERLRRRIAGLLESNHEVIQITELANKLLTVGNMNIYEETFECITKKIENDKNANIRSMDPELDMYADDYDIKELGHGTATSLSQKLEPDTINVVMWEFKWKLEDKENEIQGPYDSQQMLRYATDGYFKTGVWARESNSDADFHSTNRIDFDLYV